MTMDILDSTLGAAFLGSLAAAVLYGVTSVQTYLYFQNSHGDGKFFRAVIFSLWIVDTMHLAFTAHGIYFYLVTNFGNMTVLAAPTWSMLTGVYLTSISDMTVRCIFAQRVSILCGKRRSSLRIYLPILIIVLSVVVFVSGAAFASKSFELRTFERMNSVSSLLYIGFSAGVAADSLVAASLCILLFNRRTGIKRTDSMLSVLMAFSINTGLLTSIVALGCLVTYAIWPQRLIFLGIYFALSKLFLNSLLASLNARNLLRVEERRSSNMGGVSTQIVFPMQDRADEPKDTFQLETSDFTSSTRTA